MKHISALILSFICFSSFSQEKTSGTIYFEKLVQYDIPMRDNPTSERAMRWNSMVADLPKSGIEIYELKFNARESTFTRDESREETKPRMLAGILGRKNFGKNPQAQFRQAYFDLEENMKIEQLEFMTRLFLVESERATPSWQIISEKRQVLDYVCLGARTVEDQDTIVAYFTPEIPVSIGPEHYQGLPGAILALERNGEMIMVANSVDLTDLENEAINTPEEGSKMNEEEFEKLKIEKIEEWQKMRDSKKGDRGSKGGKGGRRHG